MKFLNSKLILLAFLLALGSSCGGDFLETTPTDRGDVATFFESEEDVLRAITGIYDVFQGSVWGGAFYMMNVHFDALTDNAVGCCPWEYEYITIAKGEHNPATGGIIDNKWDFGYEGIFRANSVLANIDGVAMPDATKTALTAETRFLRALFHGDLTNLFGDIPLVTKVLDRDEALAITRTPKAEVLQAVYEDLDFAETNLDVTPFNGQVGRPTMMSAIAMKTRLKLYNGDFRGAADEAKKLVDMAASNPDLIGLVDDYELVFSADNENNKEVLFDIQYTEGTEGEGNFLQVMLAPGPEGNPGSGWGSLTPLDGLADAFYMNDGLPTSESPLFDEDNPYLNRDERMYANLFIPGISTWRGEIYDESLSGFSPFFAIRKWVDLDATIGEDACACNENNMILYRYADVLMMYAEAVNELDGPTQDVYDAVNAIRRRANMPDLSPGLNQQTMRETIRHERHVEFAWEGTRYFDLIRWGTAKDVIPQATLFGESRDTRVFDDNKHKLWPIPQKEIDLNSKLTQNPGY
ncbi:MAG: RagB/SusD family nutrient uptake outer membrane protein [Bacteroidota bacterium]